jgi:hypothetical protein
VSSATQLFSDHDRELIESLLFNASMKPEFNAVSACLCWDDEWPREITNKGHRKLRELWMARSYLHNDNSFDAAGEYAEEWREVWEQAIQEIPTWPGFKRVTLSEEDRAFLSGQLGIENPFE